VVIFRAQFDGERVLIPPEARGLPPGEVVLIFENGAGHPSDAEAWMSASESSLAKAWDNQDDAVYDRM